MRETVCSECRIPTLQVLGFQHGHGHATVALEVVVVLLEELGDWCFGCYRGMLVVRLVVAVVVGQILTAVVVDYYEVPLIDYLALRRSGLVPSLSPEVQLPSIHHRFEQNRGGKNGQTVVSQP